MLDYDSIPHIHEIQALHGQFQDPGVKTRTDTFVERMHLSLIHISEPTRPY